jgi:hypothetical protein
MSATTLINLKPAEDGQYLVGLLSATSKKRFMHLGSANLSLSCFVDRCLSFFLWSLCYLSFFDLRVLITPFVSSNFSFLPLFSYRYNPTTKYWPPSAGLRLISVVALISAHWTLVRNEDTQYISLVIDTAYNMC